MGFSQPFQTKTVGIKKGLNKNLLADISQCELGESVVQYLSTSKLQESARRVVPTKEKDKLSV